MSRRDTILIAVLINAGLLIVLFATALKSSRESQEPSFAARDVKDLKPVELELPKGPASFTPGDEVDQVLRQYAHSKSEVQIKQQSPQESLALTSSQPASFASEHLENKEKNDFASDLNAFGLVESKASESQVSSSYKNHSSDFIEVTVKKGDVLEKIARINHTTVDEIIRVNQLSGTHLKIGQVLRIPSQGMKKPDGNKKIALDQTSQGSVKYYTVKNGDNPWTIAVRNHIKLEELLRLNHLDEEKARHLKPGDQLRIR